MKAQSKKEKDNKKVDKKVVEKDESDELLENDEDSEIIEPTKIKTPRIKSFNYNKMEKT